MISLPAILAAYRGEVLLERVEDYVRRGRPLRTRAITYLKARYLAAVRLYREASDMQEIFDLAAEVALRGETMPSLKVQACDFARRQQAHLDRLAAGPAAWGEMERTVVAAAQSFFDGCRRAPKH